MYTRTCTQAVQASRMLAVINICQLAHPSSGDDLITDTNTAKKQEQQRVAVVDPETRISFLFAIYSFLLLGQLH